MDRTKLLYTHVVLHSEDVSMIVRWNTTLTRSFVPVLGKHGYTSSSFTSKKGEMRSSCFFASCSNKTRSVKGTKVHRFEGERLKVISLYRQIYCFIVYRRQLDVNSKPTMINGQG